VTITYADGSGWSSPDDCSWECNAGYGKQSGECISDCLTDNGGCDPLTNCTLEADGVVCGACPEHYSGSGDTECIPEPRCDPSKPFGMAFSVSSVNQTDEVEHSILSKDGLSLYVQYLGNPQVYRATRDSLYADFGTPGPVTHFDSVMSSYPTAQLLSMTANGLTLYFGVDYYPYEATRSNTSQAFGSVVQRTELQNENELPLYGLWVSPSGERVYGFTLINYYLATATRSGSSFGSLSTIETPTSADYAVTLSGDELTLYWAVTGATPSEGSADIWRAERTSRASEFSGAAHSGDTNSNLWDEPVWAADDDCELYLQRRSSGLGGSDPVAGDGLFVARRAL
ncbi:MAG TPA: calcium-binding EGF-like domain-containing protein, partial [Polyangiaceae bacterium]|nr:calcium-binding EGF-like domain-containing protein [Polyangiaceae bacterium]